MSGEEGFVIDVSTALVDVRALTPADFLRLFDRIFPHEYIYPLKNTPDSGYEVFKAIAAAGARMSEAAAHADTGLTIIYSDGGSYATGVATITRELTVTPTTVKAGTLLRASINGCVFEVTQDAAFVGTACSVSVRAISKGYEYNARGARTAANGDAIPGDIDTLLTLITEPAFVDNGLLTVSQPTDLTGGSADWLSGHGDNRGVLKAVGESDDAYRMRIRRLPDQITPDAIDRIADSIFSPLDVEYEIIESWQLDYQSVWDAPSSNPGTPTYQASFPTSSYVEETFFYDDPRGAANYNNRWLDELEMRGTFYVIVNRELVFSASGFAFDGDAAIPPDRLRGTSAYSMTVPAALPGLYPPVWSVPAYDPEVESAISALHIQLQEAKAFGVAAIVDYKHEW